MMAGVIVLTGLSKSEVRELTLSALREITRIKRRQARGR
jgi:predicted transcriptional regulator